MVVRPPTGGHYLQHRFVWLLLLDLFYKFLPFFFTPNQVFVEHNMANATSCYLYSAVYVCEFVFSMSSKQSVIFINASFSSLVIRQMVFELTEK